MRTIIQEKLPQLGDKLKDNDRRMPNRVLKIVGVGAHVVKARDAIGREFRISLTRIHTDGKPRKSGFDLTPNVGVEPHSAAGKDLK